MCGNCHGRAVPDTASARRRDDALPGIEAADASLVKTQDVRAARSGSARIRPLLGMYVLKLASDSSRCLLPQLPRFLQAQPFNAPWNLSTGK